MMPSDQAAEIFKANKGTISKVVSEEAVNKAILVLQIDAIAENLKKHTKDGNNNAKA